MRSDKRTSPRVVVAWVCITVVASFALAPAATADPPTSEPAIAAQYGARWLAAQVTAGGFIPDPDGNPVPGFTVQAALSLASAGVEEDTFDRTVDWLAGNVELVVATPSGDSPGSLGYLLLIAKAAGLDPTTFGGVNLVARLQATLGDLEPGLYGASDPTFDGVFRQSLAVLGLVASDSAVPVEALDWLVNQQCGGGATPASAVGGWQAYRADLSVPCTAPDPTTFSGPDTNSAAFATEALATLGASPAYDPLAFFVSSQDASGGWAFIPGLDVDPNSTALVIQALVAVGEDPATWAAAGGDPWSSLLSWQIGCDGDAADIGAFASPFSDGFPDLFATLQSVWGASEKAFPLDDVAFSATPTPCEVPPTTTPETSTSTTTSGGSGGSGGVAATSTMTAVMPRFTG